MVNKYTKKSEIIEAVQFQKEMDSDKFIEFVTCPNSICSNFDEIICVSVDVGDGNIDLDLGDFVMKCSEGKFHIVKPDIFKSIYERING